MFYYFFRNLGVEILMISEIISAIISTPITVKYLMTSKTDAKKGSWPNTFTFHLSPKSVYAIFEWEDLNEEA